MPKPEKKHKAPAKRYVCIDLEMTEFSASQRGLVPGANGEVIQFGAVMLDEKADDFITVFDKFCYWCGEGDITTFCCSPGHNVNKTVI